MVNSHISNVFFVRQVTNKHYVKSTKEKTLVVVMHHDVFCRQRSMRVRKEKGIFISICQAFEQFLAKGSTPFCLSSYCFRDKLYKCLLNKMPYYTTRCECDQPLQAVLKICLFRHHRWACPPRCMTDR